MNLALSAINNTLNRRTKQIIFSIIDLILFAIVIYLTFSLRFEEPTERIRYLSAHQELIYLVLPIKLAFFWLAGVYRPVLRYMGAEFLMTAAISVVGSSGLIALAGFLLKIDLFPRSIFVLDAALTLVLMIAARVAVRWVVYYSRISETQISNSKENLLVYGAGDAGSQLVHALSHDSGYKVLALVDNRSHLVGQLVSGVKVYHPKKLANLVEKHRVKNVLLADPSLSKRDKAEIVKNLQQYSVAIKTIPNIQEIVSGRVSVSEIRNIDISDLLGREEVAPLTHLLEKDIQGKVVMVTGAGGSIGSELCRQIVQLNPAKLILYELNEFALYNIDIELNENYPDATTILCLATVLNKIYLQKIIHTHRVNTIYHAAAYKHVPLIESNMTVAVLNNIKGTLTCAECATECEVSTFVLISTDKAVRPTNVMGATKRIAEMVLQGLSRMSRGTRFSIVRFGNVLDSAGSVVPRFRQQIKEGKNLTVTHRDIERYFMSIPEAARLVIQAGALGKGGDVFLLDMGEPVKIYDLAVQMIELSGLTLGEDIDIEIRGLRPGEKLFEELYIEKNKQISTIHPKIFSAEEPYIAWEELSPHLEALFNAAGEQQDDGVLSELKRIVPEFKYQCNET